LRSARPTVHQGDAARVPSRTDTYISADIEADGPIPGKYSMLSFGLTVASTFDGETFEPRDLRSATFYRELKPISDEFEPAALAVGGLDRDALARDGAEPAEAMAEASAWVERETVGTLAVLVGYPLVFDWMFLHWYFVRFLGESPFGFSRALDMKTIHQQKAGITVGEAGRRDLPAEIATALPHSHNALDDAVEQADIFNRLFEWKGPR
jgi:hypothetical protein